MKTQIKSFFAEQVKKHQKHIAVLLGVNLLIGFITTGAVIHIFLINYYQTIETAVFSRIHYASAVVEYKAERELPMKEWVLNYVEEQGLDRWNVDRLIDCESKWNNWAYNINTNGTTDFGLWQWNSIHQDRLTVSCRWDYKCATEKAVEKIKREGNMCAWVCSRKLGLCK